MPLFICIAGMVASLKVHRFFEPIPPIDLANNFVISLAKGTKNLLIPFFVWTVVYFYWDHNTDALQFIKKVFISPDVSLWFLVALFYCQMMFSVTQLLVSSCRFFLPSRLRQKEPFGDSPIVTLIIIVVLFLIVRKHVPDFFGLGFFKGLFPYYVLGIYLYKYKKIAFRHRNIGLCCLVLFILLSPFWYRTESGPVEIWLSSFIGMGKASLLYRYVTAFSGIMAFLMLTKMLVQFGPEKLNRSIAVIGSMTLGIYGLHWRLLWVPPPFFSAFLLSIIGTWVISKIPVISFLLLGKKAALLQRRQLATQSFRL